MLVRRRVLGLLGPTDLGELDRCLGGVGCGPVLGAEGLVYAVVDLLGVEAVAGRTRG
jgi:hypothetical protein